MNMPQPSDNLVSIITCFLNEERFLEEAILSVIGQTYSDWELILVDDGSSDNSKAICSKFIQLYPDKIFYYDHPGHVNRGLSASRNAGIEKSRGEWIALLDADDVWDNRKLENQLGIAQQHPDVSMICEASQYWSSWNNSEVSDTIIKVGNGLEGAVRPPELLKALYPLGDGAAPCPSAIIFKKTAWQKVGGFQENFDGIFQMYEDQAFLCKVYFTEIVYLSPLCHNLYRQRAGSLVHDVTAQGKYHTVRRYFLTWFQQWLREQAHMNQEIHDLLQKALRPSKKPIGITVKLLLRKCLRLLKLD